MPHSRGGAPRVLVAGLGGTIAMTRTAGGGVAPALTAEQLLGAVPGLDRTGIEVEAVSLRSLPGSSVTVPDLLELLETAAGMPAAGVVVTQGTDTIEETAYVLDLLHRGPRPIVVTGAMRNPTLAGADGPANLLAAITVAAAGDARDLGCLVAFADEIHAARRVRKTHTTSVATFVSPDGGPLGYVVEGTVRFVNRLPGRRTMPLPRVVPLPAPGPPDGAENPSHPRFVLPRVGLCTATLGDDGALLAAVADRLDGLVVAAFGAGHVPAAWPEPLSELAGRIPVVLGSRTGAGSGLTDTYGFAGGERDLLGRGLIPAGFLHPYKARLLLQLALAAGAGRAEIEAAFAAEGHTGPASAWPFSGTDG